MVCVNKHLAAVWHKIVLFLQGLGQSEPAIVIPHPRGLPGYRGVVARLARVTPTGVALGSPETGSPGIPFSANSACS